MRGRERAKWSASEGIRSSKQSIAFELICTFELKIV